MRAVILDRNGSIGSLRVGELDPPRLGPDTILVRVHAAAVNPADLKVVTGKDGGGFLHAKNFPMTFGFDFSGVVEEVGANVRDRSVGDEVFGFLAYARSNRQGSFAELVAVSPKTVGTKPPGVTHEDAAATATVGSTALQALRDTGRLKAGHRVLVNGASGGVGSHAVQIATQLGAEVWGTASAAKAGFVRSLGAAQVIDYKDTPIEAIDAKFDLVLDAASKSSFQKAKGLLNRGGAYVTLLASAGLAAGLLSSVFSSKRCGVIVVKSRTADLDQLAEWLAAGHLNASVDQTFALSEIAEALTAMEAGGAQGKIAVRIGD